MLYHLLYPLHNYFSAFNIFRYITFRAAMAAITAFLISLCVGGLFIRILKRRRMAHLPRTEECPGIYPKKEVKAATPTMGGLIILAALVGSVLLWSDVTHPAVFIVLVVTLYMGLLGLYDDLIKVRRNRPKGIGGRTKLLAQCLIAAGVGLYLFIDPLRDTSLDIPFVKHPLIYLGWFYIPFAMLVLVGTTNAVNLTDGQDGLAIGCVIMTAIAYSILSYVTGHARFAHYLGIPYVEGSGELTVVTSALIGAGLGFLWFNAHPAEVFMGDTGALALGGAVGTVALFTKKEILLLLAGGIFVIEALSVLMQVASFRLTGRRIFRAAPLHHHFQLLGWEESKIVARFWIVGAVLVFVSLASLKIR
ncbi:MAG: phospho-N-acetylmuramoyl-pentapeptide-transferase [Candidatus Omnitrophica bacterium]|nr:phospho-N-acetylmuramoyl-pentapeptide-transferase [Candidatus Omnitrophota bacterium]